jgi:3-isopropylmalate/(R)-2-methylmalate dehydratase small subunit
MINLNPEFPKKVKKGDFIVAGKYFGGCWLHNHCAYAIKGCGVGAVIADSIFSFLYRALIDLVGVPVLIGKDVSSKIKQDDELEVNIKTGEIRNLTSGEVIRVDPIPNILLEIIEAGNLVEYIKKHQFKVE